MTVLSLRFPAGRFHATPWGRHVNEGAVEWPPSPWRLLRALLATWYAKASEIREDTVRRLLDRLAEAPPAYALPQPASLGHTRHYLPFNEGRNEKTTKVFDTFVHVPADEDVQLRWDADLEPDLRGALATLLDRLGYFGRAESLVEAGLLNPGDAAIRPANVFALSNRHEPDRTEEIVRLLAPLTPDEYAVWRDGYLAAAAQFASPSGKPPGTARTSKLKKSAAPTLPTDLFSALHADTGELQASGWALPPGAQTLAFVRSARAFEAAPLRRRTNSTEKEPPTIARFAVASAVLPRLTGAVSVADRVHQRLLQLSDGLPVFTGRGEDGNPTRGNHGHAHILCEVSDRSNAITHLTLFARQGFDSEARLALRRLHKVWGHGGHDLQLVLLGFGQPGDFAGTDGRAGQSAILQSAREWVSVTPFVPTRHGKFSAGGVPKRDATGHQIGSPEHDLLRLLGLHWPEAGAEIVGKEDASPTQPRLRWLQFQRRRTTGEGHRAGTSGFGFRVRFNREVAGPIAVGYGAHFGLGLFQPADADSHASPTTPANG